MILPLTNRWRCRCIYAAAHEPLGQKIMHVSLAKDRDMNIPTGLTTLDVLSHSKVYWRKKNHDQTDILNHQTFTYKCINRNGWTIRIRQRLTSTRSSSTSEVLYCLVLDDWVRQNRH